LVSVYIIFETDTFEGWQETTSRSWQHFFADFELLTQMLHSAQLATPPSAAPGWRRDGKAGASEPIIREKNGGLAGRPGFSGEEMEFKAEPTLGLQDFSLKLKTGFQKEN
jgi:hypothetical protein